MPFVQRVAGVVTGVYANRQPGYAEEFLDDDHPDVAAYRNPPPAPVAQTPLTNEDVERLLRGLGVSRAQITAAKQARGQPLP